MTEIHPDVERFLASGPLTAVVGGRRIPKGTAEVGVSINPASGEPLTTFALGGEKEIDEAAAAATGAFETWGRLSGQRRCDAIRTLAAAIDDRAEVLARLESLDCGKLFRDAESDVHSAADTFRFFASIATLEEVSRPIAAPAPYRVEIRRFAWGTCGFITPWNFPLLLACWGIAPAIAAGNTIVLKPAEQAPLSAIYLANLAAEVGFPDGVINVVPGLGEVAGAALARHPGVMRMAFTGSPEVGRRIAAACAKNLTPVKLELGGKGAAVVLDDVQVEKVARRLADWLVFNAGQVCCTPSRWVVHRKILGAFVETAAERLGEVRIGCPGDPETEMGPLVSDSQRERVLGFIQRGIEEGAEAVLLGKRVRPEGREHGFFLTPTLLSGPPDNIAAQREIFGPVGYILPFETEEEAIEIVNGTPYGLANSVWSEDPRRAANLASRLVSGVNWINRHNELPLGIPYAGVKQSGLGGGVNAVQTYWDYRRETVLVQ